MAETKERTIEFKKTKNLGDFNNVTVRSSETIQFEDSDDVDGICEEAFETQREFVERRIAEEVQKHQASSDGG